MTKKTFNFADNPAMRFISSSEPESQPEQRPKPEPVREKATRKQPQQVKSLLTAIPEQQQAPAGYSIVKERKTKRLQIIIQPSIYTKLKETADQGGSSVNDYIIKAIQEKLSKGESENNG